MDEIHDGDDKSLSHLLESCSSSLQSSSKSFKSFNTDTIKQSHNELFNQATLLLHEACESGDTANVEKILSGGKANLNSLIGEHRTYRSALHKASAYGHTHTVKLLLKAGASADKCSSVQRTALHEACMGGHRATVVELVQYINNLDMVDNHGQTAAHIAAYHGETECLKVLIDSGCDLNCGDNQTCTPAHLAVLKNYPETLRCLLKNNVDILKSDGQGRTPVHYAALYGSTDCLKVFKEYHIDLKITDHNGGNACHHASCGGHVDCLKYLTKVGLSLEAKDKSAKTSAHYAAQKGSTECLHWLLEQGVGASIQDTSGNTPAHCASSGHMQAMNCLVVHNSNMSLTNTMGDSPEMLSRKCGNTIGYEKAVNGTIRCPFCIKQQLQLEYDLRHQPSEVEKTIKSEERIIFKSPIKTRYQRMENKSILNIFRKEPGQIINNSDYTRSKTKAKRPKQGLSNPVHSSNSKRNLSAQYFGEHLFSLTSDEEKLSTATQRNDKK